MILEIFDDTKTRILYSKIDFLAFQNFDKLVQYMMVHIPFDILFFEFPKNIYYLSEYGLQTRIFRKLNLHENFSFQVVLKNNTVCNLWMDYHAEE